MESFGAMPLNLLQRGSLSTWGRHSSSLGRGSPVSPGHVLVTDFPGGAEPTTSCDVHKDQFAFAPGTSQISILANVAFRVIELLPCAKEQFFTPALSRL
jgi:hypothetical protein